jgi:hypothetical protein
MGKPVEVRVLSRAVLDRSRRPYLEVKTIGKLLILGVLIDYLRAAFRRAAQRAFINCESLLRPAAVSPPFFFAEGAVFVPAALLLAAQRAFINSESFLRPAAVSAPFFLVGVGFAPPFSLAQRALAAAESLARVEGEK